MNDDLNHLRLLSIFHYVVAGFAALFSLFPVIHLVMGILMVTGHFPDDRHGDPVPSVLGWFFIAIACLIILAGLTFALCVFLAGRFLTRRRHYLFCLVVAGFASMFMPFGTVLGVFTIIVLLRPSVKELFGQPAAAAREG
jgi:hypothetical protein